MIVVSKTITADNSDILANTDFANIPANGQLDIFLASTQNDTVVTITGPANEPIIRGQTLQLRSNGMPLLSDDIPFSLLVTQGGHYVINIDIVTGATVNVIVIFRAMRGR